METLLQKRVDGLLLMCTENHRPSQDALSRYPSLPIVMMDWAPFEGANDIIQDNSLLGGEMATDHLIARGYRNIACIAGPQDKTTARHRLEGYRRAMGESFFLLPAQAVFSRIKVVECGLLTNERYLARACCVQKQH